MKKQRLSIADFAKKNKVQKNLTQIKGGGGPMVIILDGFTETVEE